VELNIYPNVINSEINEIVVTAWPCLPNKLPDVPKMKQLSNTLTSTGFPDEVAQAL